TFTPLVPPDQVRLSLQSIRTRLGDSSAELRGQAGITQAGPGEPCLTWAAQHRSGKVPAGSLPPGRGQAGSSTNPKRIRFLRPPVYGIKPPALSQTQPSNSRSTCFC